MIAAGDALRELAQFRARQQFAQFRLAHQDDLQEFLAAGLEIGQQPHLLQHFASQGLGFVDDEHHAPAFGVGFQQTRIQRIDKVLGALLWSALDMQLTADAAQEFREWSRVD